ncbi:MAG: polysaccharide deacetylase family protein [Candidatus Omnitrophota bacterium]
MRILAYHSINNSVREAGAQLYCVSEDAFRGQLEYLRGKDVVITFDDGDITSYTKAYPILKEFNVLAYFFIIGEWVGAPGYMNWDQISELKHGGMIIGSHGMSHRVLTTLNDEDLGYEFGSSKKLLEDKLKTPIETISIPRGLCNKKVINKIREYGYVKVFTSDPDDSGDFLCGRIAVRADWDMKHFMHAVDNGPSLKDKTMSFIKKSSRAILGDKGYDLLRSRILK